MESNTVYIIQTYNANNEAFYASQVKGVTLNLSNALQIANNIVTDIKSNNNHLNIESFDANQSLNLEYNCYFITNFIENDNVIYGVSIYKKDITQ
jgi:hypothetical protein